MILISLIVYILINSYSKNEAFENLKKVKEKDNKKTRNKLGINDGIDIQKGEKGEKGDKGEKGEKGFEGPQGEKGERGYIGKKGKNATPLPPIKFVDKESGEVLGKYPDEGYPSIEEQAKDGIQEVIIRIPRGIKGDTGETGKIGQRGATGMKGESSQCVDKGDKGDKGERGEQGEKGEEGKQGPPGKIGPAGLSSSNGLNGIPGMKGSPAPLAKNGKDGKDGKDGRGVLNALINKKNELVINYSDNTNYKSSSLKGETGDKGDKGDKGNKGDKGDKGDSIPNKQFRNWHWGYLPYIKIQDVTAPQRGGSRSVGIHTWANNALLYCTWNNWGNNNDPNNPWAKPAIFLKKGNTFKRLGQHPSPGHGWDFAETSGGGVRFWIHWVPTGTKGTVVGLWWDD